MAALDLSRIVDQAHEHLREVDQRRDRMVASYVAVLVVGVALLGLLARYLMAPGEPLLSGQLWLPAFLVTGFLFLLGLPVFGGLCECRKWHAGYQWVVRALQRAPQRNGTSTAKQLRSAYEKEWETGNGSGTFHWLGGVESSLFNVFLIVHAASLFALLFLIGRRLEASNTTTIVISGLATVLFLVLAKLFSFRATKMDKDEANERAWLLP